MKWRKSVSVFCHKHETHCEFSQWHIDVKKIIYYCINKNNNENIYGVADYTIQLLTTTLTIEHRIYHN